MVVVDTHVLIWLLDDPKNISRQATQAIASAREDGAVYVSSMTALEIYALTAKGRLRFSVAPEIWLARCEKLSFVHFIPIDNDIANLAYRLPHSFHGDPADRVIAATAQYLGCKLVTRDRRLRSSRSVETIW